MTKFNSQICTNREQSERLLALGLKKETADMFWWNDGYGFCAVISRPAEKEDGEYGKVIPAWSLHRLWELANIKHIILDSEDEIAVLYDEVIMKIEQFIEEGYFNK
jgi:hypothetical protein